ncbi:MAG: GNAT family N-acetyltransferase [Clostridia bacterium]|nr:GNAT family N-acetyltransferase [Clostridia bacterium]
MSIKFRNYKGGPGFSEDFHKVRDFLIRISSRELTSVCFMWERWEWAFSFTSLDVENLSKIGIWEDGGRIVGLATYEDRPGTVFFCLDREYGALKKEMLAYAIANLGRDGVIKAAIYDDDPSFQKEASLLGMRPTQHRDYRSIMYLDDGVPGYSLPDGYRVCSLLENFDILQYNRVLWRGFNHGANPPEDEDSIMSRKYSLSGPHLKLDLNIAIVSPEGNFVSYCGMWYDESTDYAFTEPVATDPDYRMKGLGKAAVLEGIKRSSLLGAKKALVGSSQQFYFNIGFRPMPGATFWEKKL